MLGNRGPSDDSSEPIPNSEKFAQPRFLAKLCQIEPERRKKGATANAEMFRSVNAEEKRAVRFQLARKICQDAFGARDVGKNSVAGDKIKIAPGYPR